MKKKVQEVDSNIDKRIKVANSLLIYPALMTAVRRPCKLICNKIRCACARYKCDRFAHQNSF